MFWIANLYFTYGYLCIENDNDDLKLLVIDGGNYAGHKIMKKGSAEYRNVMNILDKLTQKFDKEEKYYTAEEKGAIVNLIDYVKKRVALVSC